MELPALPDDAVELGAPVADWRGAIELAGSVLSRIGAARPGYADAMIRMVEDRGPYIVIAPGLALAHARSGQDVKADGLAVVTLAEPVAFGHPHNDPVRVVLALAAASPERHLPMLAAVANAFNARGAVERIAEATTPDEVRAALAISRAE
ncbi:PTS sugar transporter subunit IIA [Pseudolysinimonas sp.]|uniref:PTS sugar transporter subunit IIA n=1 Tax=Pseudolysinimonas sp. TaxID=2680009 RepID=UPI003F7DC0D9